MGQTSKKNHTPVLLEEVLKFLKPKSKHLYVDATFGSGGYSTAILSQTDHDQVIYIYYN